jgi:DNA-binding transcriptional MerR regulator
MTVGQLSRLTGVTAKKLRAYTDWGLIYSVGRTAGNYRLYDLEALWCVRVVGELRGLGLTLAEIREVSAAYLKRTGEPVGPLLLQLLDRSRGRLRQRIAEMQTTLGHIDAYVAVHRDELDGGRRHSVWGDDPRRQAASA